MKATKTFVRNGRRYKPGETIEGELDPETIAHYRRLGMIPAAETGKVIPGTAARLAPNTPQRVVTRSRSNTGTGTGSSGAGLGVGTKVPGTPEAGMEVKQLAPLVPSTVLPGPADAQTKRPDEGSQTGPSETSLPPGPQENATPPVSLPLGSTDSPS